MQVILGGNLEGSAKESVAVPEETIRAIVDPDIDIGSLQLTWNIMQCEAELGHDLAVIIT